MTDRKINKRHKLWLSMLGAASILGAVLMDAKAADLNLETIIPAENPPLAVAENPPLVFLRTNRVAQYETEMKAKWKTGDVIFFGDSLTDLLHYNFNPLAPRVHNVAISGDTIDGATDMVNRLLVTNQPASGEPICNRPSKIFVLIGANDLTDLTRASFTDTQKAAYTNLFQRLGVVRSNELNNGRSCTVVIEGNLPGKPVGIITNSIFDFHRIEPFAQEYLQAITNANAFLQARASEFGFEYLDRFNDFWDATRQQPIPEYYYNYTPVNGLDRLHLGPEGARVWMRGLKNRLYPVIAIGTSTNGLLDQPSAAPTPQIAVDMADHQFRYGAAHVGPYRKLTVTSSGATGGTNYAAIFNLLNPSPAAAAETRNNSGSAVAYLNNTSSDPLEAIVVGSFFSTKGSWNLAVDTAPLNTNCATAGVIENGKEIEGELTYHSTSTDGVWYSIMVPQPNAVLTATFHDTQSSSAQLAFYTGACDSLTQYTNATRSSGTNDLVATIISTAGQQIFIQLKGKTDAPVLDQSLSVSWGTVSAVNASPTSDSVTDSMPDIVSDSTGALTAVWYQFGSTPALLSATSTNLGYTWSTPVTVYQSSSDPIRTGSAAQPPRLAFGSNLFMVTFPTVNNLKVASKSIGGSWTNENLPQVTNCAPASGDILPTVSYRASDDLWIAAWLSKGDNAAWHAYVPSCTGTPPCPTSNYDLVYSWRTTTSTWLDPVFDANAVCWDSGMNVRNAYTSVRPPPVPSGEELSAGIWLEVGNGIYSIKAGYYTTVYSNTNPIYNPQMAWNGTNWILAWSMMTNSPPNAGITFTNPNYEIYYSVGNQNCTTWTAPRFFSPNTVYDGFDDFLDQLVSHPNGGLCAIWHHGSTNAGEIYVSQVIDVANPPPPTQLTSAALTNNYPRLAVTPSGGWVAIWQAKGGSYGSDGDIVTTPLFPTAPAITELSECGAYVSGALIQSASPHLSYDSCIPGLRDRWFKWSGYVDAGMVYVSFKDGVRSVRTDTRDDVNVDIGGDPVTGRAISLWDSYVYWDDEMGNDWDIRFSSFYGNGYDYFGANWKPSRVLNPDASYDNLNDIIGSVAPNKGGTTWLASWGRMHLHPSNSASNEWEIAVSRSIDNGRTWTTPAFTTGAYDRLYDFEPQVRAGTNHNWLIAYGASAMSSPSPSGVTADSVLIRVCRSTNDGVTWATPQTVATYVPLTNGALPSRGRTGLATDGKGNWVLVADGVLTAPTPGNSSVVAMRSSDDGVTWSAPVSLPRTNYDAYPRVATDGRGKWVCAFTSETSNYGDVQIYTSLSTNNGASWSTPVRLSSTNGWNTFCDIACEPATGHFVVVWSKGTVSTWPTLLGRQILSAYSTNGVNWGSPQVVATNSLAGGQSRPRIATSDYGKFVTVWAWNNAGEIGGSGDTDIMSAVGIHYGAPDQIIWSPVMDGATKTVSAGVASTVPAEPLGYVTLYSGSTFGQLTQQQCVTTRNWDGSITASMEFSEAGQKTIWIRVGSNSTALDQSVSVSCEGW